ncbi:hypothetical protein SAMN02745121_04891 [Nannocystis exedens]|uniref:Uncharacterized protein n=1 Tax=Nannocystis exedens TaxID=54 RepID=A0A1I2C0I7_9BACT|nr:hypothetical protein [Nannocystis exedens]PCC71145.1 hypothetical protein NAEX_04219 [Nannocystis exedens]SFE61857.1 hypothetical protein SAMN02745121_04891 [Nannocystis exedens]
MELAGPGPRAPFDAPTGAAPTRSPPSAPSPLRPAHRSRDRLGDTYETVEAACLADRDPEEEPGRLSFGPGSVYSGVIFTFASKRDQFTEIFFGAAAE